MHEARFARSLARAKAGSNIAARIAMMAMTTSNSIKVNALVRRLCQRVDGMGPIFIFNRKFTFCIS